MLKATHCGGAEAMRCPHGAKYANKSDEELMVEFYGCDNEAFEEVWDCRWRQKMRRYVARRVCNAEDVEDILQDAAIKVVDTKNRPSARYNPHQGAFGPWLSKVVDSAVKDYHRKNPCDAQIFLLSELQAETAELGEEYVPEPPELVDETDIEKKVIIRRALRSLSEPSRTIVKLYYWGDWTIEDIARELGLSVATVHRRLKEDLKRLKEKLRGNF